MSTTLTMMRLHLRMQSMDRIPMLPYIGNAGILYSSPLHDKERYSYMQDTLKTSGRPEFGAAKKLLVKPGALGCYNFWRAYSTSTSVEDVKKAEKEREKKNKFKLRTAETIKVLLISETGSVSAVTLLDAQSIAKKKRLELVQIKDNAAKPVGTEKDVYKLVSKLQSASLDEDGATSEDDSKSKGAKGKDLKTVMLKGNTGEHDINAKISQMQKWVTKGHRVRVLIGQVGDKGDAESVYQIVEKRMKEVEGQIQQKVLKGREIRFYIGPPKTKSKTTVATKDNASSSTKPNSHNLPQQEHDPSSSSSHNKIEDSKQTIQ